MLKETVIGITQALKNTFGEDYPVYTEDAGRDLNQHCFIIKLLKPSQEPQLLNRYKLNQPFDVQYCMADSETQETAADVIEVLYQCLEYITVDGDMVRGIGMKTEIAERVLHFFVDYNLFVIKKNEEDAKMDDLDVIIKKEMD